MTTQDRVRQENFDLQRSRNAPRTNATSDLYLRKSLAIEMCLFSVMKFLIDNSGVQNADAAPRQLHGVLDPSSDYPWWTVALDFNSTVDALITLGYVGVCLRIRACRTLASARCDPCKLFVCGASVA
jgi:hypothetical protein